MNMTAKILFVIAAAALAFTAEGRKIKPIEGAYYGTNYTVPFAHAYRALGELGVDRKEAIDRDVYHMSRLGFNGFRLHLWDVELSDSVGNLIENDHLDLLDYLLAQLEKRGISVILTAQTNFGNGYPERNTDPYGAYSYRHDKCLVHSDADAIAAQENYIAQLVKHVNPYTGLSYAKDPAIIAMEINNEPCHGDDAKQVTEYINAMARAMRKAGWQKTVLYNVSHNQPVAHAYYDADIDGTTYQWYPLNLVSGHSRKGNFMPFVDQYEIPFKEMPNYDKLSRVVYEFDPADNILSYIFPAAARTFRKEGFQWATQFAYDPTDMAWANTEYQTHYLNLAYTPSKAIGMMVAAEVMRQVPEGADYGKFPADTVFGPFTLSPKQDLAILNDGQRFYYTNPTTTKPSSMETLQSVAGVGSSPVIQYDGTGAYFADLVAPGVWRIEVMPDVMLTADPFGKPSLQRRVGEIFYNERPMTVSLPGVESGFAVRSISNGTNGKAQGNTFTVSPGVYLIGTDADALMAYSPDQTYGDGHKAIGDYAAPAASHPALAYAHDAAKTHSASAPLKLQVKAAGEVPVDSVVLYPGTISYWRAKNDLRRFSDLGYGDFELVVDDPTSLGWNRPAEVDYNIVVWQGGKATTYPQGKSGTPLDWDYDEKTSPRYSTELYYPGSPLRLLTPSADMDGSEISTIPTQWDGTSYRYIKGGRLADDRLTASIYNPAQDTQLIALKYVGDLIEGLSDIPEDAEVCIEIADVEGLSSLELALITNNGLSYNAQLPLQDGVARLRVSDFTLSPTLLCPEPYPVFLGRVFTPGPEAQSIPLHLNALENIQLIGQSHPSTPASFSLKSLWIE